MEDSVLDAESMHHHWQLEPPPEDVGVLAHGRMPLSRGQGISAELHHLQAHAQGLMLHLVLRADGVYAEAAKRQLTPRPMMPRRDAAPDGDGPTAAADSSPLLHIEVNDLVEQVPPQRSEAHGTNDAFEMQAQFWIGELPRDGRVAVAVQWPQAGLPLGGTVLDIAAGTAR
ncbi:hypothetical protein GTQ99_02585 [Kineococcus sp. T13]|uniref:hypothetical protein n=1 Tax=Kineococcus vitellinus TaxID=2696565 RepID=UPI001411C91C|nr:hypothetical protein [Kineococcus vitellinus]NAZ74313.1 hypothetical protein [Kineococcus vitellinus]